MSKKAYTTKDIARLAEVSRATVHRVLHGKGPVSDQARKKVEDVLNRIDYKPNVLARSLQSSRTIVIAAIVPSDRGDVFWKHALQGLESARAAFSIYGVQIDQYLFDQTKVQSFKKVTGEVLESKPDGIIIVPFFYKESVDFFIQCVSRDIPYISFNTHVDHSQGLGFVGQDLFQSGHLAARLILKTQKHEGTILIIHIDEDKSNSMHMQEKEDGFRHFLINQAYDKKLVETINIRVNNEEHLTQQLGQLFEKFHDISGIFVTTSKAYKVAKFLKYRSSEQVLVGYDLVEENLKYLRSGQIDFLINQNSRHQAHMSASYLVDHLVFRKEVPKQKLLSLDIIIPENLSSYLDTGHSRF